MMRLIAPGLLIVLVALKFALHWEADATFFAAIALALFVGALIEIKTPSMIASALDQRSQEIAKELTEARKLREQAAALLVEYQTKQKAAEAQAADIIAQAKVQADAMAKDAKADLADALARHERSASDKIARAEAQAIADVRAAAVEAAIDAAEHLLKTELNAPAQDKLVERGLADLQRAFTA